MFHRQILDSQFNGEMSYLLGFNVCMIRPNVMTDPSDDRFIVKGNAFPVCFNYFGVRIYK